MDSLSANLRSGSSLSTSAAICVKMSGAAPPSASKVAPATSSGSRRRSAMRSTAGAKKASPTVPIARNKTAHQPMSRTTLAAPSLASVGHSMKRR